ncbi:MAG TPA: DUF4340 domain-containing protein [Phycisphaerae bacterium]|nr:DUF4340 domain-containing protein [Phycisphaerae bacterium]
MNFRLTLSMVIVLVLVLILYIGITNHQKNATPENDATKNLVISPAPTAIKTISYTQDGDKQVAFEKIATGWNLTYPTTAPANTWDVDPIADGLKTLSFKEKFEPEVSGVKSPQNTGTDKPRNVITFSDDAGHEHTLNLGKATIGGIFATIDGGKTIYLLSANPLDNLQKDPNDFRNRTIKETPADRIAEIQIKHPKETISLEKSGDRWLIDAPITARANHSTVDEIINEMKGIHAFGFSDLAKTQPATGLNPPVLAVTAMVEEAYPSTPVSTSPSTQPSKKTPVTLELGYYTDLTSKNAVYASLAGSDGVFTVSADTFKKLDRQLKELRDPAITPAPVANATDLSINTLTLKKEKEQWQITSLPHPIPAGISEVNSLLADIAGLRAINYADNAGDLKSIGLDPPQITITLTVPGQSQKETLLIGKPETADKVTPMMRQGEPTVYLVQTADADKIAPTPLTLRDKTVDKLTADAIRTIAVSGEKNFTLQREGSTWSVTEQNGKPQKADELKITPLLGDFTPVTAAKYLAEESKTGWNLPAKPDLTVMITSQESAAPTSQPTTFSAAPAGPTLTHPVTHTLRLYKDSKTNTWKAVWDGGSEPQWLFEPVPTLIAHLTATDYPVPTTQPATQPAAPAAAPQ